MCTRETVCVHNVSPRRYLCIPLSRYGRRSCDCNKSNLVGFVDHTQLSGEGEEEQEETARRSSLGFFFRVSPPALFVHHIRIEPAAATPSR